MKNGQHIMSVLNKGGTKSQGGQLQYCLTGLFPSDVITIELDGEGTVTGCPIQVENIGKKIVILIKEVDQAKLEFT